MPQFYRRYVDDTIVFMPSQVSAQNFLNTLNNSHDAVDFTMEIARDNSINLLGMTISKNDVSLETKVKKSTNKGLLLHYDSHVDIKHKRNLIHTMLNRAYKLSSTHDIFLSEVDNVTKIFQKLNYPLDLISNIVKAFNQSINTCVTPSNTNEDMLTDESPQPIRIVLPYKDQTCCNTVTKQLKQLSAKIENDILPVFTSRKIGDTLKPKEMKPRIINSQCVVYKFQCGLCDTNYVGYTCRHLYKRINEHNKSIIGDHLKQHGITGDISEYFRVLSKCNNKFDCLIKEMLWIKEIKPTLNKQSDSIKAKLFI
ncbi:uncharacterized protein [Antedon mediterranea]|uniref:uncharacterized protein n=1 Tax=Antedon mediterranea TaxID=105859 RepID=UPI003AF62FDC